MSNLSDIIKTVKKVNQEVIVLAEDVTLVVMPFNRYDQLLDKQADIGRMSEEEFLNEINRQVALWRASQERERLAPTDYGFDANPVKPDQAVSQDDTFYIEPVE